MAASRATPKWIGFKTIIIREFSRIVRIWGQTIVPPAVTATLYFIIFGSLIGRRVGQVGGYDYMQFIAPGLIMMTVITNSYGNVVSSFFGAKFGKHLEELLVSPLPNWLIVAGYTGGGILRGVLVGSVVTIVSLFFTRLALTHVFAVISAVLLTSIIFGLGGFINARRSPTWEACFIRSRCCPAGRTSPRMPIPFCTWSARSATAFSAPRTSICGWLTGSWYPGPWECSRWPSRC